MRSSSSFISSLREKLTLSSRRSGPAVIRNLTGSDTASPGGLGAANGTSAIRELRPVPRGEAHDEIARRVDQERIHLDPRPRERDGRAIAAEPNVAALVEAHEVSK